MKFISILKGFASLIIGGLGQVLNRQWFKGLFFFVIFLSAIGVELGTSSYFEDTHAYNKIPGEDFEDSWVTDKFMTWYLYDTGGAGYETFETLLKEKATENGLSPDFTSSEEKVEAAKYISMEELLTFLAEDIKTNNPKSYRNLANNTTKLATDVNSENNINVIRKKTLYKDPQGLYYLEENVKVDNVNIRTYVEVDLLTETPNRENTLSVDEVTFESDNTEKILLTKFTKTGELTRNRTQPSVIYIIAKDGTKEVYINVITGAVVDRVTNKETVQIKGPLVVNVDEEAGITAIYEYFEPELNYDQTRLQYKNTAFSNIFRHAMFSTYNTPGNAKNNTDYTRLMLMVYFDINTDVRDAFLSDYNNFFYDRAGMFLKGYWAVGTLGTARKIDFVSYMALSDVLLGNNTLPFNLTTINPPVSPAQRINVQGHFSTTLLLEGLIGVILSLFFMIFLIWGVTDAYKVSEARRLGERVLDGKKYWANLWESSFEYIVLFPALFVLAFISIMPIIFGFILAFTSISGNQSMTDTFDYVGLHNFLAIFNFSSGLGASFGFAFWRVLGWTAIWAVGSTFTVFFGGFIQALILNSEKVVMRKFWRSILILPWAIPAILSQMVFSVMFKETGFVNQLFNDIGLYDIFKNMGILGLKFADVQHWWQKLLYLGENNIQWFTNSFNPNFVKVTLIVVNIWLGFPYFMALMSSIMTSIDKTLYEAADIDGATGFQKIRFVTIPMVLYSTAPILIMTFSGNFNNFGVIYFITGGGPNTGLASRGYAGDTDILISWMYKLTVDHSIYNMASVFSVMIFLVVGTLTAWNLSRTKAFKED
ncbi:MAG: sugar ABC transporter permease [Acholeplasmataceae bacterium]|nr:sugar ABC transporter permease [Acholeplasmataceae bacterium]MDD4204071.1 sugar ABC transporter permease [Acholeplasmataceae bacterium]MDD4468835.1 sugar ABC transporter permease [Acholeplasmataceae bacterium]MDD4824274.1 sugar ABC transporter permease [Acholeplasmataceae bacterium]